jgi:hypothetical protein
VADNLGGTNPALVDPGTAGSGAVFNTATFVYSAGLTGTAQNVSKITIGSANVSGVDFGFNFNTVVNVNDTGQGSLRQAITNANTLSDDASLPLAQTGRTAGVDNIVFMIPNGKLADGTATNGGSLSLNGGLRSTINLSSGGVASIAPATGAAGHQHHDGGGCTHAAGLGQHPSDRAERHRGGQHGGVVGDRGQQRGRRFGDQPLLGCRCRAVHRHRQHAPARNFIGTDAAGTARAAEHGRRSVDQFRRPCDRQRQRRRSQPDLRQWRCRHRDRRCERRDHQGQHDRCAGRQQHRARQHRRGHQRDCGDPGQRDFPDRGGHLGAGNTIVTGSAVGVSVASTVYGVTIRGNAISSSSGLGIDLGANGITANTGSFGASLANRGMNTPVISTVAQSGTTLTLTGYVGSAASQSAFASALVDFYVSDGSSTNGSGSTYLGSLTGRHLGQLQRQLHDLRNDHGRDDAPDRDRHQRIRGHLSEQHLGVRRQLRVSVISSAVPGVRGRQLRWGAGRARASATGFLTPAPGTPATVELYNASGVYVRSTTTAASGAAVLPRLGAATYFVRVVSSTVRSAAEGSTASLAGLQTFRTDASGGTVTAVTD